VQDFKNLGHQIVIYPGLAIQPILAALHDFYQQMLDSDRVPAVPAEMMGLGHRLSRLAEKQAIEKATVGSS
jgi:2-methylisocitrate lyase-like PEP mutase family enzyme